jgi:Lrp/AsnC family transcriptional regulator, leucine-responsive regulatory protein
VATKESSLELDEIDWRLLDLLRENARLTFAELGRQVHLSLAAVAERVRKLEEHGVINGYHAALNARHLNLAVQAFLHVTSTKENCARVVSLAQMLPEVREAYRVTGSESYLIKVYAVSIAHLEKLIDQFLAIADVTTSLILSAPVQKPALERIPEIAYRSEETC